MILIIQLFILIISHYNFMIVKMNTIKFMFRARNNLLPINLKNYIQLNYIIPIYFID